ncbi:hypothetical protein WJX84_009616 [Apatococcus fuscideae]|uniref:DJ-1/PfpI domain-containing protein n=1 Tax=Apatococcus fuscideae TaxID=2026836 RepID=A0AAW1SXY4_9CHLO
MSVCVVSAGTKTVLVPIANGSEEIEAVTIIDVLRRAGASVTVASVEDTRQVEMSRQVQLVADKLISDCVGTTFDAIALPGGMPGAESLCASKHLETLLMEQQQSGRLLSAICAAPAVVLESKGLLKGLKATCHPGFQGRLANQSAISKRVVEADNIITSQAPGTAMEFSLAIVQRLFGEQVAQEVAGPMVVHS